MRFAARTRLGLALGDRSILAAEVRLANGAPVVVAAAEFAFPQGVSMADPVALGVALGQFLRSSGFRARRAVIGLPAKWLVARGQQVPPAKGQALAGILKIRAEREFAMDVRDLTLDYVGRPDAGGHVLLVAAPRTKLEQALSMAGAARLRVQAVTSSGLLLASEADSPDRSACLTVNATSPDAEVVARFGDDAVMLRHISGVRSSAADDGEPNARPGMGGVADELRRVVALLPGKGGTPHLVVWPGRGQASSDWLGVGEELSLTATVHGDLAALGLTPEAAAEAAARTEFASAVALAVAGAAARPLPIDFLHSHLVPHNERNYRKPLLWTAAVAAAMVIAAVAFVLDWRSDAKSVAMLQERLDTMRADVAEAKTVVAHVSAARDWYDRRPEYLECLRELALSFPEYGPVWASTLALKEDMRGLVSGKSESDGMVLQVLDSLEKSAAFEEVKLLYLEGGGRSREVSFAISFCFVGAE